MTSKKIVAIIALGAVICTSCKNSLNVQAPYKDVTVVYALMDQNDSRHYIRINKGFEGNGNAYTMAKQYDSIYYPVNNITAVLEDSNPTTDAVVNINLDTTTTVPLGPGTFSYPKQLLYYTDKALNPNDYYNLVVTNNKSGKKVRGSTTLLQDVAISALSYPQLTLESEPYSTGISWTSSSDARIYQMSLLFYYDNQLNTGPRVLQAPLELVFPQQTVPSTSGNVQMSYSLTCQQLFSLILSSIQPEQGVQRYPDSLGIVFTSGTDDLNTYIQLSQPPSGINQDIPSYSDVQNGVGLYTARHVQTFYKKLDKGTLDSLSIEQRFINLGF